MFGIFIKDVKKSAARGKSFLSSQKKLEDNNFCDKSVCETSFLE